MAVLTIRRYAGDTFLGEFPVDGAANRINNAGKVVDASSILGNPDGSAFLWQNGIINEQGPLRVDTSHFDSGANAIHDTGQIVGLRGYSDGIQATLLNHGVSIPIKPGRPDSAVRRTRGRRTMSQGRFSVWAFHRSQAAPHE
jgi:uncharacterized membrane protein